MTSSTFTLTSNPMLTATEVHLDGCRASERDVKGQPSYAATGYTAEKVAAMRANPDEGALRVHRCAAAHLSA